MKRKKMVDKRLSVWFVEVLEFLGNGTGHWNCVGSLIEGGCLCVDD